MNGNNGSGATGGIAPAGGGNGGNGKFKSSGAGTGGSIPGGGGGGAYRSSGSTTYTGGSGANGQVRLTYYVNVNATTTNVNCGAGNLSVDYGSSINCVATVTGAGGTSTPTGTVSWTTNGAGSFATSPCTLSGTGASASCSVTYTPSSVGSGLHSITACYSGDGIFLSSCGNQTVTVNRLNASVTPNAASKIFGQFDPELNGVLTGFLPADNVTATYSRTPGETVDDSPYTISATLSPVGVLDNYNVTYNTAAFTITPVPTYTLTINIVGNGTATKSPDKAAYQDGEEVTLTAVPYTGWSFGGWSENVVGGAVTIHGDTAVTATFTQSPTGVVLVAPSGILGGWDNTFSWTGISSAEYYHLEVYDAADTLILGQWYNLSICTGLNCVASPLETGNLTSGDYTWRVQTYGSGVFSPWTDFMSFTINAVDLNLISPTGALNSWDNSFRWSGISNAEYYHLELRDASSDVLMQDLWFNTNICLGLNCAASPAETQNLANGDYKWRLQTYGPTGYTPWTEYLTFSLNAPISGAECTDGDAAQLGQDVPLDGHSECGVLPYPGVRCEHGYTAAGRMVQPQHLLWVGLCGIAVRDPVSGEWRLQVASADLWIDGVHPLDSLCHLHDQ